MVQHDRRGRWAGILIAIAAAAAIGFFAYNAGIAHGAAVASQQIGGPAAIPPYAYGWYRPWGFGLFGPFLFFAFWLVLLRGVFWGGPWRRYGCSGGAPYGGPTTFDEWHRRAHERMTQAPSGPPADDNRSRG
jgi:hypothetical protein